MGSFWRSFWSETGRNTGKWTSNKIFGTSGWATPKRLIIEDGEKHISKYEQAKTDLPTLQIIANDEALKEHFDTSNLEVFTNQMDQLLVSARNSQIIGQSTQPYLVKIRSGINRLNRMQEFELASFYRNEIRQLKRSSFLRSLLLVIILLICLFGLLLLANT